MFAFVTSRTMNIVFEQNSIVYNVCSC
uniref:Uncharacterized protein n=1 Tax=Arundo donax TaxID=35708 RepID=A0A0A9FT98_ARUDO